MDYKRPVCSYWPDFAQNGKEAVTLEQLISNQVTYLVCVTLSLIVFISLIRTMIWISGYIRKSDPISKWWIWHLMTSIVYSTYIHEIKSWMWDTAFCDNLIDSKCNLNDSFSATVSDDPCGAVSSYVQEKKNITWILVKVWKLQTRIYWVCSLDMMKSATTLLP